MFTYVCQGCGKEFTAETEHLAEMMINDHENGESCNPELDALYDSLSLEMLRKVALGELTLAQAANR